MADQDKDTEAKPEAEATEAKPGTDATEAEPETGATETKPEAEAISARAEDRANGGEQGPPVQQGNDDRQERPRGGRGGIAALFLTLLVAAGAAGGGYYLYMELQALQEQRMDFVAGTQLGQLEQRVDQRVDELAGQSAEVERRLEDRVERLGREASDLRARLTAIGEDRAETDRAVVRMEEALSGLRRDQAGLAERMSRVDALAQAQRVDWLRGEAGYLARVAQHRLQFHQDVDAALGALRMADRLLADIGTEALTQRQAISRAVDRLLQVQVPDSQELALRLQGLLGQLDRLPVASEVERARPEPTTPDPALAEHWQEALERAWGRFTETLGELVVVQRERDVVPLLAPTERYYLYQNLRLNLEAARMALLTQDQAVYRASLEQALDWIGRYYDTASEQVTAVLAELERLSAVDIAPELPELDQELAPVTEPQ